MSMACPERSAMKSAGSNMYTGMSLHRLKVGRHSHSLSIADDTNLYLGDILMKI